jgi:hypothetical protein
MLFDHQITGLDNVGKNLYLQLNWCNFSLVHDMTKDSIKTKMVKLSYSE